LFFISELLQKKETMPESFFISHRQGAGYLIIDIKANAFTYPQNTALKTYMQPLLEQGHLFIAFNLSQVETLDSFGLATIISILKTLKEANGALVLYGLNAFTEKLVEMTRLDKVLDVWSSEAQAIYCLEELIQKNARLK
jgi:anti-sigma B factor antagonist